jgi:hypothetical protein
MSTLAYAAMTRKREESKPGTSTTTSAPGVNTYVDALAALVPAEVLTAHAAILTFTTDTVTNAAGKATVTITQPDTLFWVFWALILVSMALYVAGRLMTSAWDNLWDWPRMVIPPLAFVGWTMLQKATAFDAVAPGFSQAGRSATAIIGAILLGLLASGLAYKADQKPATTVQR